MSVQSWAGDLKQMQSDLFLKSHRVSESKTVNAVLSVLHYGGTNATLGEVLEVSASPEIMLIPLRINIPLCGSTSSSTTFCLLFWSAGMSAWVNSAFSNQSYESSSQLPHVHKITQAKCNAGNDKWPRKTWTKVMDWWRKSNIISQHKSFLRSWWT